MLDNYEKLKETKIIYEYLNDLLTNGNFEIPEDYENALKTTMSAMAEMYNNTHSLMYKDSKEYEQLKTNLPCPCCDKDVIISDLIPYAYVCDKCDENYYLCEGDLNYEWYFEDKSDEKLEEDFDLDLSYDAEEKNVIIGTETSSGAEYECRNIADLKKAIASYAYNYLNYENDEEYSIKIWETDFDRDQGFASQFLEKYKDSKQAVKMAKKLMELHDYACVEVINEKNNFAIFNKDKESESTYFYHRYHNRIFKVSSEELQEYVGNWVDKKGHKFDYDLLYCENSDGSFTAVDDSDGQCWTEDFETEAQAVFWLDTDIPIEDVKTTIIPRDVLERVYDLTKEKNMEIERC